ncbi:MAG TPA: multiheme c-type cytochrome [Fimbriimonadaceae bacterium]|nr:multiheme c-type cytochrome [Fimbriimonadaceae bacterium]
MKLVLVAGAVAALVAGTTALRGEAEQVVILSGDTQGYLSPCGCSSPMIGGIRRKAALVRKLSISGNTTYLENGGLVEARGRQDAIKAETLAESFEAMGVTAINVGPRDAGLGIGAILQLSQFAPGKLITLSIANPEAHYLGTTVPSGPFLVGGATEAPQAVAGSLGDSAVPLGRSVKDLVDAAETAGLKPVLMLQGSHDTAARLAHDFPDLALIEYSAFGSPPLAIETVGSTVLATPGESGKFVVALTYRDGRFGGYRSIALGPELKDDPEVSRYYAAYLRRVKEEKLIDALPRKATAAYAGSWACGSCHASATHIWKGSDHRFAFQTLRKQMHDADPDCVSCHVVGLDSTKGFRSQASTPQLAGVGCESCHGPALNHVKSPSRVKLPRITQKACLGCHNPLNSPNFEFNSYWRKIAHR